ncbi:hypothetical protein DY000_02040280 [Brassica cretica]|uniref:Uncharacterized protein n=1 Tax=Brassica cretica TaxID=69181 RepID=A0ABQ7BN35_BRACR|nr:hypothetical protein DY000_02040280 [Brassica cretica]
MRRPVKMVLVLGSRGRRVGGFVSPEEFTGGRTLQYWSGHRMLVKTRISVRVLSRFMAKERILNIDGDGFSPDLRLAGSGDGFSRVVRGIRFIVVKNTLMN